MTQRYQPIVIDDEGLLTVAIIRLAGQYGRYGYRRITALLRTAGWRVNHKRVERIWRREGLKVPRKQPKRGRLWLNDGSCIRLRPCWRNHVRAYDFVQGRTHDGRAFRMLTVIDEFTSQQPICTIVGVMSATAICAAVSASTMFGPTLFRSQSPQIPLQSAVLSTSIGFVWH